MAKPVRTKNKDNARRAKKKVSLLLTERVEYVDWKDVNLLRRFMSDRAKIRARRVTGNSTQQQAEIARAIKNAREMALLPYASRVTQTRGSKRDGERGGRRERDLPAPDTEPMAPADELVDDDLGDEGTRRSTSTVELRRRSAGARRTSREGWCSGPTSPRSARRATSSTCPTATAATSSCPRGSPSWRATGSRPRRPRCARAATSATPATAPPPRRSPPSLVPKVVTITARAGAEGKLFGSVSTAEIAEAVTAQTGVTIDRRAPPPRRADQDRRHAPRPGEAPRRGRVPDHRRGRRLLGALAGPRTTRHLVRRARRPRVVHRAVHSGNPEIPRVSATMCLW